MGRVAGTIQKVAPPSKSDLAAGEVALKKNNDVGALAGAPKVTCPDGAESDFPIPSTNTEGPSKQITHIFFVVRENKSFDGIFGDFPGVDGKADLVMTGSTADQDRLWRNFRELARAFTLADNFYTPAELSQQGHFWDVYGRSSEYNERTWAIDGYTRNVRQNPIPSGGVLDIGQNEEGSLFDWLATAKIPYDVFGEAMGAPHVKLPDRLPVDMKYPGGFIQSMGYPDVEKACYVAARLRVACDIGKFVFQTLSNDHTVGVGPRSPTPDSMVAVNDEATGMLVDAIAHSPIWKSSIIFITEDDPSGGGEHVDVHRTPLLVISPWVKRGYVTKTHIDVSSVHKMFAHLFGLPYPNVQVANAAVPFDLFTSTPDYTPWETKGRVWPLSCGEKAPAAEALLTESFETDDIDESPGIDRQVERWLAGAPFTSLTPAQEAIVRSKIARKLLAEEAEKVGAELDEDD
jgi:hypothetical protein